MAELKLYPVGIQTFEEIITRNLLYVEQQDHCLLLHIHIINILAHIMRP